MAQGLKKTSVAELCADAGISKGSFYLFYPSKEALFFEIQQQEEQAYKQTLLHALEHAPAEGHTRVRCLLEGVLQRLERHPFLRTLTDPQTVETLITRLPPDMVDRHRTEDREFFIALATRWKSEGILRNALDDDALFHAVAGLFVLCTQRELLGASHAHVITTMTNALVDYLSA